MTNEIYHLKAQEARITELLAKNMPVYQRGDLAWARRQIRREIHKLYIERKSHATT